MIICYSIDMNYLDLMLTSIKSVEFYNSIESIYVFHDSLDEKSKSIVEINCKAPVNFIKVDSSLRYVKINSIYNKQKYFSKETFFRLLVDEFIVAEKLLFLDPDTIILGSLKELFELEMNDYEIAAVPWYKIKKDKLIELNMKLTAAYFNVGVMLLNLKNIKKNDSFNKVINYYLSNQNLNYELPDQDLLNSFINGNFLHLNKYYNYHDQVDRFYRKDKQAIIVHYTGRIKPHYFFSVHVFKKEFLKFYRKVQNPSKKRLFDFEVIKSELKKRLSLKYHIKRSIIYRRYFKKENKISFIYYDDRD